MSLTMLDNRPIYCGKLPLRAHITAWLGPWCVFVSLYSVSIRVCIHYILFILMRSLQSANKHYMFVNLVNPNLNVDIHGNIL